jgi:hypothetical protein
MPDDVVKFLESVFDKPMHTWIKDPGYAGRVVGLCPPPSNSDLLVSIFPLASRACGANEHVFSLHSMF